MRINLFRLVKTRGAARTPSRILCPRSEQQYIKDGDHTDNIERIDRWRILGGELFSLPPSLHPSLLRSS